MRYHWKAKIRLMRFFVISALISPIPLLPQEQYPDPVRPAAPTIPARPVDTTQPAEAAETPGNQNSPGDAGDPCSSDWQRICPNVPATEEKWRRACYKKRKQYFSEGCQMILDEEITQDQARKQEERSKERSETKTYCAADLKKFCQNENEHWRAECLVSNLSKTSRRCHDYYVNSSIRKENFPSTFNKNDWYSLERFANKNRQYFDVCAANMPITLVYVQAQVSSYPCNPSNQRYNGISVEAPVLFLNLDTWCLNKFSNEWIRYPISLFQNSAGQIADKTEKLKCIPPK